jgi:transcriptional regulator with XRE-family HTH domain
MGTVPTKAAENIYCQRRKEAARFNDKLNSREGAAEMLGISASSLADYELGNTKIVPVDKVNLMADVYNAPDLRNHYCTCECPLGQNMPKLELAEIDRLTIKIISGLRSLNAVRDTLLEITEDGQITEHEKPQLQDVLDTLDEFAKRAQELKLWAEKHLDD